MTTKPKANSVAYYAYTAEERGEKTYWNRIGAAFLTKNGTGLQVRLSSLPIDGSLTLLPPEEKAAAAPEEQA